MLTPDSPKPDELQKNTCVEKTFVHTIGAEQLRKLLSDHRHSLRKRCFEMKQAAMRIENDIANIDALLEELTTN